MKLNKFQSDLIKRLPYKIINILDQQSNLQFENLEYEERVKLRISRNKEIKLQVGIIKTENIQVMKKINLNKSSIFEKKFF